MQQFQAFWSHFNIEVGDAGEIATRTIKACDEAEHNRVGTDHKDSRDNGRCYLGRQCRRATRRNEHGHSALNQFQGEGWQPLVDVIRPAVFDRDIALLDVAGLSQASFEGKKGGAC